MNLDNVSLNNCITVHLGSLPSPHKEGRAYDYISTNSRSEFYAQSGRCVWKRQARYSLDAIALVPHDCLPGSREDEEEKPWTAIAGKRSVYTTECLPLVCAQRDAALIALKKTAPFFQHILRQARRLRIPELEEAARRGEISIGYWVSEEKFALLLASPHGFGATSYQTTWFQKEAFRHAINDLLVQFMRDIQTALDHPISKIYLPIHIVLDRTEVERRVAEGLMKDDPDQNIGATLLGELLQHTEKEIRMFLRGMGVTGRTQQRALLDDVSRMRQEYIVAMNGTGQRSDLYTLADNGPSCAYVLLYWAKGRRGSAWSG